MGNIDWGLLLGPLALAVGAYLASEALGAGRGKRGKHLKNAAVLVSLGAGLSVLVALSQFGWVRNPPTWLAVITGAALLWQAAVALRDLLSDGEPDRQCRIAALLIPLLLFMGGAWLVDNAVSIPKQGTEQIQDGVAGGK